MANDSTFLSVVDTRIVAQPMTVKIGASTTAMLLFELGAIVALCLLVRSLKRFFVCIRLCYLDGGLVQKAAIDK